MNPSPAHKQFAREAKAVVALAFRNGPIENLHAGTRCPTCRGQSGYSRITDEEMRTIMKSAVNRVYSLLCLKSDDPARYESQIEFGNRYTAQWDEPDVCQFPFAGNPHCPGSSLKSRWAAVSLVPDQNG